MTALRFKLMDSYKPKTVTKFLSALRGVLKESWQLGLMTDEDYRRAVDLKSVRDETLPAGRKLTPGEIVALMAICEKDPSPIGLRDAAIIGLIYATGLKREEMINLDLKNYTSKTGRLVVFGKRKKERSAYLTNKASDAIGDWLKVRGDVDSPLFLAANKGGRIDPRA